MIATLAGLHTKFGFVPGKPRVLPLHAPPDLQSHCGRRHIDAYDLEHPDLHFHGQADPVYVLWRRHDGIDFGSLVEDVGAKPRHIPEVISERLRRDGDEHGEQSCDASIRHHCNGGNRQACGDNAFGRQFVARCIDETIR